jgi:hypothetical protein
MKESNLKFHQKLILHMWKRQAYADDTTVCSLKLFMKLYKKEYIVVFWLNDILVNTKTQWDGSYKKKGYDIYYKIGKVPKIAYKDLPKNIQENEKHRLSIGQV